MDFMHQRYLGHFVEQDVVGHMEAELEEEESALGRVRVAIGFADLAGYTRFTEEEGEEEALVGRALRRGRGEHAARGRARRRRSATR